MFFKTFLVIFQLVVGSLWRSWIVNKILNMLKERSTSGLFWRVKSRGTTWNHASRFARVELNLSFFTKSTFYQKISPKTARASPHLYKFITIMANKCLFEEDGDGLFENHRLPFCLQPAGRCVVNCAEDRVCFSHFLGGIDRLNVWNIWWIWHVSKEKQVLHLRKSSNW